MPQILQVAEQSGKLPAQYVDGCVVFDPDCFQSVRVGIDIIPADVNCPSGSVAAPFDVFDLPLAVVSAGIGKMFHSSVKESFQRFF